MGDSVDIPLNPSRYPDRGIELGGVLEVAFATPDAFALDDTVHFVVPPIAPVPVVVFYSGTPDRYLTGALDALASMGRILEAPLVPVEKFTEAQAVITEQTAVVFDRCAPPAPLTVGAVLMLGAPGARREIDRPVVSDWNRSSPLWAGIDLTGLAVRRANLLSGLSLIESTAGPIAVVERRGGFLGVTLGFSLEESDFALRVGFPLFLRNWVEWVRRGATRALPSEVRFGAPLAPEIPWGQAGEWVVRSLRGDSRIPILEGRPTGTFVPDWPGIYRISAEGRQEYVAVNAWGTMQSDPSEGANELRHPPSRSWVRKIPYVLVAAAFVLLLLLLEWFLYHRGWI